MENNVYLTVDQKQLIVTLAEKRTKEFYDLLDTLDVQGVSDEQFQLIHNGIKTELNRLNNLCRAVYRKG